MLTGRNFARAACLLALAVVVTPAPSAMAFEGARPDDVARFLAGLEPAENSPLVPLTREAAWRYHARALDLAWAGLEHRRLAKIRAWSAEHLTDRQPVVLYMFSGPDFLYVDAFFPKRKTYVLSGLEPVGQVPVVANPSRRSLASALAGLRASVGSSLDYSFFKTKQMKATFSSNGFKGVQTEGTDPETGESVRLFNPRVQRWPEHFAWSDDGTLVLGRTPCGRATVGVLQLNNVIAVMVRREWVAAGWHPPRDVPSGLDRPTLGIKPGNPSA